MPLKHLLEDALAILHHDISVARHNVLETPRINPLHAGIEAIPVILAQRIPQHAFLPYRGPIGVL